MASTDTNTKDREYVDRRGAVRLAQDQVTAEAIRRKEESRARVLRGVARRNGLDPEAYIADANQRETNAAAEAARLAGLTAAADPEGTRATLADRAGNFAPNAAVAGTGGIGVDASNTVEGGTEQAQTPEEAGTVVQVQAPRGEVIGQKIIGDRPVDDPNTPGDESADIPEGWEDMGYQQRRRLAHSITGDRSLKTGEDVDEAIRKEQARRSRSQ